jgi:membrane protein
MASEPSGDPPPAAPRPSGPITVRAAGVLAWRVALNFANDRVTFLAGGVTFFVILGAFPALSAFLALFGLYADPRHAPSLLDWFRGVVPPDVLAWLGRQMTRLAAHKGAGLSVQFTVSLALWIWTADAAVKALIYGLSLVYHHADRRSWLAYTWLTLSLTLAALAFVLVLSGLTVAAVHIEVALGVQLGLQIWRWPALFLAYLAMLWQIYRYGPCRPPDCTRRRVLPGALLATALSLALSMLFSWYLADVTHLGATYGPLGGAVAFMLWTWLTVSAVLAGGELNGELERGGLDS